MALQSDCKLAVLVSFFEKSTCLFSQRKSDDAVVCNGPFLYYVRVKGWVGKEVCNGGVACSLLKLGSLEKTVTAPLFHSGLHSSSPFFVEKTILQELLPLYSVVSIKRTGSLNYFEGFYHKKMVPECKPEWNREAITVFFQTF